MTSREQFSTQKENRIKAEVKEALYMLQKSARRQFCFQKNEQPTPFLLELSSWYVDKDPQKDKPSHRDAPGGERDCGRGGSGGERMCASSVS